MIQKTADFLGKEGKIQKAEKEMLDKMDSYARESYMRFKLKCAYIEYGLNGEHDSIDNHFCCCELGK